jgi:hypothetical protein
LRLFKHQHHQHTSTTSITSITSTTSTTSTASTLHLVTSMESQTTESPATPYLRYQSTPWSERAVSTTESLAIPYPRHQTTPIPTTDSLATIATTTLPQLESDDKTAKGYWRRFLKDESNRALVLRLCLSKQDIFGHTTVSLKAFWKTIAKELATTCGYATPH